MITVFISEFSKFSTWSLKVLTHRNKATYE